MPLAEVDLALEKLSLPYPVLLFCSSLCLLSPWAWASQGKARWFFGERMEVGGWEVVTVPGREVTGACGLPLG